MTNADMRHIARAIKAAELSTMRHRHGAVIAQGRRIMGVGVNTYRSDPNNVTEPKADSSFHAEVMALRSINYMADGMTLYVARVNARGHTLNSAPCERCGRALRLAGIRRIVYTTDGIEPIIVKL